LDVDWISFVVARSTFEVMKTRSATLISVFAVASAAAVALAVNTNLFARTTALADTQSTIPEVNAIEVLDPSGETNTVTSNTEFSAAISSPSNGTQTSYDLPGVGSVTLTRNLDELTIDSTSIEDGYNAEVQIAKGSLVKVEFRGGENHYEFRAMVVAGEVVTDVSVHGFPQPGGRVFPGHHDRDSDDDGSRGMDFDRDHEEEDHESDD
jgi:hypothetical protein